jgi:hypothetical protein
MSVSPEAGRNHPAVSEPGIFILDSSEESVGEFWFGQLAK